MTVENEFIEMRILGAVRKLLALRVNEILSEAEFQIPLVDFGDYEGLAAVAPVINLSACECSEKERIIRLDAYSVAVSFSVPETPESELHCYAYAAAVCRTIGENPTLGGIADRAVVTGKKYAQPKKKNCGECWEVVIGLRVTVEEMKV